MGRVRLVAGVAAVAMAALLCGTAGLASRVEAAEPSMAELEACLAKVPAFKYGESRAALADAERMIPPLALDAAQRKAIEKRLIALLDGEGTNDSKAFVCRQLSFVGSAEAVPSLAKLLPDKEMSHHARIALERIPAAEAVAALRSALERGTAGLPSRVLVGVINSLGERKDAASASALIRLVGGASAPREGTRDRDVPPTVDEAVAEAAVAALGKIGGSDAAKAIAAVWAKSSGKDAGQGRPAHNAATDAWLLAADGLVAAGKKAEAAAIYKEVYDAEKKEHLRVAAFRGLLATGDEAAWALIIKTLSSDDPKMTPWLWGVMSGVSSVVLLAQVLSAWLTQRVGRRKLVWFVCALAGRLLRLTSILTALLLYHLGSPAAATVLIVGVCLCNFCGAVATPPWMSWLTDLIPERTHGGFWGRRASWIDAAVMLTVIPTGLLLDRTPEAWKVPVLVAVFVVATAIGIVDLFIHNTLPEPPLARPREAHYFRHLAMPLRDRAFRPWLRFSFCWTFAMTFGGSLSLVYFVKHLGMDRNLLGGNIVLTIIPCLGSILVGSKSGKMVDKVGSKRVLWWGHLFWAILPGLWIFATPATAMIWLTIQGVISGTGSRAATTAANKLVTRFPASQDVAVYTAVSACVASIASAIGCFSAGYVLRLLDGWSVTILGWTFIGFHVLFVTSLILRLASALFLIRPIHEARRQTALDTHHP